ncbi:MAG: cyclodeaminase/cyclohydrolase family protein [Ferroplasma sp.]
MELYEYISELKSSRPTPGGGSASAITAMFSASLNSMASLLSLGKKKLENYKNDFKKIADDSTKYIEDLKVLMKSDEECFSGIMAAFHMDKSDISRPSAINNAIESSISVSWDIANISYKNLANALFLCKYGNKNLITDSISSGYMAYATLHTSVNNIKINLKFYTNTDAKLHEMEKLSIFLNQVEEIMKNIRAIEDNINS